VEFLELSKIDNNYFRSNKKTVVKILQYEEGWAAVSLRKVLKRLNKGVLIWRVM
jgi:hypothetical protein